MQIEIKKTNAKLTLDALVKGVEPVQFTGMQIRPSDLGKIPYVGTYLPIGWKRVCLKGEAGTRGVYMADNQGYGAYFVDCTGLGKPTEPALTINEFINRLNLEYAYAIVEIGRHQAKIGVFKQSRGGVKCRNKQTKWN